MNKKPSEISAAGMEEFEKVLANKLAYIGDGGQKHLRKIKSHILSQELALLKSVEEWAEGRKRDEDVKKIRENFDGTLNEIEEKEQLERNKIYNHALSDLLAFLQEQAKLIKEEGK